MRKNLGAGLVLLLPLMITVWLFWYLVDLFTNPFLTIATEGLQSFGFLFSSHWMILFSRILIVLFLVLLTFLLGIFAKWFFIRFFFNLIQRFVSKIPLLRSVYKVTKEIAHAFFALGKKEAFTCPVLVPFPSDKSHAVSFSIGPIPECCQDKLEESFLTVLVPTAPHPISGFLLMVPAKKALSLPITNEEAIKFTVSCGVILPNKTPPIEPK